MARRLLIPIFALVALVLVACSSPVATSPAANTSVPGNTAAPGNSNLARTDSQGSVEFVVTPLNLAAPGDTIDFDISMNTHSVDLSWNLAAQSSLTTDTGLEVNGLSWPGGSGHHVGGRLTFPAVTADGKPLLDGVKKLTLTIRDAGAPVRTFEWEVTP